MFHTFWIWLTYWPVKCKSCNGTGICALPGQFPDELHSCCGECERVAVPIESVPKNYIGTEVQLAKGFQLSRGILVGNGVMYVRPWSLKTQVTKPIHGKLT